MSDASLEQLLDLLEVRLDAFAMCEIDAGWSLACDGMDQVVIHFVLAGEGSVESDGGNWPLRSGTMIVIPRSFAKRLNGPGAVSRTARADAACPLADGMVKFRASGAAAPSGLVLGCGAISAAVGEGYGLFDHLAEPLAEHDPGGAAALLFEAMLRELSEPGIGTRALVGALMKQIVVILLRTHMRRQGMHSPLYMPLMHPQLGRALVAIVARPSDEHSVESLAALSGMSRSRFSHHFTATYGRSPMAFVQAARLRAGARLLRSTRMPVKAISASVGYASRSHFSRAFRSEFGLDPSAYRDAGPSPAEAAAAPA